MEYSQFINCSFVQGRGKEGFEVMSPSTRDVRGTYPYASPDDVRRAIASAKQALPAWKRTRANRRSLILRNVANEMRADRDALARQISLELGKPYTEAQKEVDTAAEMFEWA